MLVLIGNSPSSGSTFLADLLDSIEGCFCGPELSVFANPIIFYDFNKYVKKKNKEHTPLSLYKKTNRPYYHNLEYYGVQKKEYQKLLDNSKSIEDFTDKIIQSTKNKFKNNFNIFFEKSPENIASIKSFLDHNETGYFIHIVRNPIYVYKSLVKRGFPKNIALFTWYFDVLQQVQYINHPRVINVKYEDLINDAATELNRILKKLGKDMTLSNEGIERQLAENKNRNSIKRVKSWSSEAGKINNANKKTINEQEKIDFKTALKYSIHPNLARLYNVPSIPYSELIKVYGYGESINSELKDIEAEETIHYSFKENIFFLKKGVQAILLKNVTKSNYKVFTNPLKLVD